MEVKTLKAVITYQGNSTEMVYQFTNHFAKRSRQRAISDEQIEYALNCGEEVEKQGFLFYIVGDKISNKGLSPQKRKKLKNLVVVTSADENVLITTYRNNDPFKHVAKKPKRIVRYAA
jgi:hypothetical protein